MELLFSVSYVNRIDGWKLFNTEITYLVESFLIKQFVQSMYLFQQAWRLIRCGLNYFLIQS